MYANRRLHRRWKAAEMFYVSAVLVQKSRKVTVVF